MTAPHDFEVCFLVASAGRPGMTVETGRGTERPVYVASRDTWAHPSHCSATEGRSSRGGGRGANRVDMLGSGVRRFLLLSTAPPRSTRHPREAGAQQCHADGLGYCAGRWHALREDYMATEGGTVVVAV